MVQMMQYQVIGKWPFPVDMLRHDQAIAEDEAEEQMISLLSRGYTDEQVDIGSFYTISLRLPRGVNPNEKRWESFGWRVSQPPLNFGDKRMDNAKTAGATLADRYKATLTKVFKVTETTDEFNGLGDVVGIFPTKISAETAANGKGWYGGQAKIEEVWAVPTGEMPGQYYILESKISYGLGIDNVKRANDDKAAALAKLTPRERKLLGLEE